MPTGVPERRSTALPYILVTPALDSIELGVVPAPGAAAPPTAREDAGAL